VRFLEMVQSEGLALDRACLGLAECFRDDVDEASTQAALDGLAGAVEGDDAVAVVRAVFDAGGFRGDEGEYHAVDNSMLDRVVARRLGMPITLAVVMIEVGRRAGVELAGVAMPGHFLVRSASGQLFDPFNGGRTLARSDCVAIFQRLEGSAQAPFDDAWLRPVRPHVIVVRILANLERSFRMAGDGPAALVAMELQARVPGVLGAQPRRRIADTLADGGRFDWAASIYDALVEERPDAARDLRQRAAQLRARLN